MSINNETLNILASLREVRHFDIDAVMQDNALHRLVSDTQSAIHFHNIDVPVRAVMKLTGSWSLSIITNSHEYDDNPMKNATWLEIAVMFGGEPIGLEDDMFINLQEQTFDRVLKSCLGKGWKGSLNFIEELLYAQFENREESKEYVTNFIDYVKERM